MMSGIGGTIGGVVHEAVGGAFADAGATSPNHFCDQCGAELTPGAAFCDNCGAPQIRLGYVLNVDSNLSSRVSSVQSVV